MELQRDSGHFKRYGNYVSKSEDWYSDSSGDGVVRDGKYFDLDFGFDFTVVERFYGGYFKYGVEFRGGFFEEEVEFGRM